MPVENFKVGEMLNKRTPNTKTWINFDGSYTTEIYQGLVHYQDGEGNFHNINTDLYDEADFDSIDFPVAKDGDSLFYEQKEKAIKDKKKNRLNRENYDFQGLKVPYEVKIPRNIRRGYSIGKGASKLTFIPVNASVAKGYVEGNKITYPDVWNDADLVLELLPQGVKETIILKTDKAPINFSFEVQGELSDELKIQPMWLQDAEGTKRDVLQGVSEVEGKTFMDVAADTSGLVFPIEIDPTVTIQPDTPAGKDTSIYSDSSNSNFDLNTSLYISQSALRRALIQFNLSSIPTGAQVTLAELELYSLSFSGGSGNSLAINEVTSSWVENTVTWNTQPSFNATAISTTPFGPANSWRKLTITSSVDKMVNGILANNGWVLKCNDETGNPMWEQYYSSDYTTDTTKRPKLTVTYNQPPTAPVVTAPNGGETFNSLHTVTWNAATDPVQDETNFYTTTWFDDMGGNSQNVAQTFTMPKSGLFTKIRVYCKVTSSSITSLPFELRNVNGDGTPGSTVLHSFNLGVTVSFGQMEYILQTPLNVVAGQKIALVMTGNTGSYYFHFGGRNSGGDGYTGGGYYMNGVHQTGKDAQLQVFYKEISDLQYQIQLSTNNGGAWKDIVALTAAGATSYAYDFINEAESSTCLIRVRAYDGSAYGPWDQSNGVFTIVHNQAPTAPTGLSPSGVPKDRATVIRFAWVHNDPNNGDPQSKFDLLWRLQGSGTWNTVTQATTNNYYDMPAGTLPKGTIEWQVRTYDQAGLSSPYSALTVFTAGDKPATPVFVTPADGEKVSVARPVVQWSSVGQTGYEVKVLDATGTTTLWTTGQVNSTNKAVTVGMDFQNNTDYDIQVLIKNADGLWSSVAVSNVRVSYTPPLPAELVTTTDSARATIDVEVINDDNIVPFANPMTANFVGKIAGSTVENPHDTKHAYQPTLQNPTTGSYVAQTQWNIDQIKSLDGNRYSPSTTINGSYAQTIFSFNLIEEYKRKIGLILSAQQVKDVTKKLTANWHGYGSSPTGNKAYLKAWNGTGWSPSAGNINHTLSTVGKLSLPLFLPTEISTYVQSDGFIHFLAYAEASNGTVASTINTDFIELLTEFDYKKLMATLPKVISNEVYRRIIGENEWKRVGYVTPKLYGKNLLPPFTEWTLHANATVKKPYELEWDRNSGPGITSVEIKALPNTVYNTSLVRNSTNAILKISYLRSDKTVISSLWAIGSFTTPSGTEFIKVELYADVLGVYTVSNVQLELGSVATTFEPQKLGGRFTDYTPASGKDYEYYAKTIADNETNAVSGAVSESVEFKGIFLHVASDPQKTNKRFLTGEQKGSSLWNLNHTFHKFAGRQNLVIDTEDSTDYGVNFTLKLRTREEIQALESIIYSQDVVCYRDSRGRKVFGVFVTFPMDDEFWGEATSLNLTKIDYKEEIE